MRAHLRRQPASKPDAGLTLPADPSPVVCGWAVLERCSDIGAANELVKSRGGLALAAVKFAPPPHVDTAPRTASGLRALLI